MEFAFTSLFIFSYPYPLGDDIPEVNNKNTEAVNLFKVNKKDTVVMFSPHCGVCIVIFEYIYYIKGSSRTFASNVKQIGTNELISIRPEIIRESMVF